jgi:hypothetical protein
LFRADDSEKGKNMPVVISTQPHKFARKFYKKGAKLTVTHREAQWLVALGRGKIEAEKEPEVKPEAPKRTYKRKDIQTAAPLVVEAPVIAPLEIPEVPAFKWPSRDDGE